MADRDALARDLHEYGVCPTWGDDDHDDPGPCHALADHIIATHDAEVRADERRRCVEASREDARWNTAIDWLMNHGTVAIDLAPQVFAFTDGLITEEELRSQELSLDEINQRRERSGLGGEEVEGR